MHKQVSRVHGFTVIELMVVVAILAIITSIAIPWYSGYVRTAYMQEANANIASLRLAEEEFYLENNDYFEGANTATLETNSQNLWKAAKGKETSGAADGFNFSYAVAKVGNGFTITATGKAGTPVAGETVTATK